MLVIPGPDGMIFFITLFRYFTIVLFFTLHFFSFSQGMQTQERAHCARSVFPFIKKKKKKKKGCIPSNKGAQSMYLSGPPEYDFCNSWSKDKRTVGKEVSTTPCN